MNKSSQTNPAIVALHFVDFLIKKGITMQRDKWAQFARNHENANWWITNEEADLLASGEPIHEKQAPFFTDEGQELSQHFLSSITISLQSENPSPLAFLASSFQLNEMELSILSLLFAIEADGKYEKLYAYLQDNSNQRFVSKQLLELFFAHDWATKERLHQLLSANATLRRFHLIEVEPGGMLAPIRLSAYATQFLLAQDGLDPDLKGIFEPPAISVSPIAVIEPKLLEIYQAHAEGLFASAANRTTQLIYLEGNNQEDKPLVAQFIANQTGRPLMRLDFDSLLANIDTAEKIRAISRMCRLLQAAIFIPEPKEPTEAPERPKALFASLMNEVQYHSPLIFLDQPKVKWDFHSHDQLSQSSIEIPLPSLAWRETLWSELLAEFPEETKQAGQQMALSYRYGFHKTQRAAQAAMGQALARNPKDPIPNLEDLVYGCQSQSKIQLGNLAKRIQSKANWEDLILPENKKLQLRLISDQYRHQARVFQDWGFNKKLSYGKGLHVLFSGSSGTGKTMAAGIIAKELGLAIYKINLSAVTSKWVGETEKNLASIFEEASRTNAILFFDEADALFGKRSQVTNSNDRYANMETSFLLQQMEEYEGITILASNLQENMDQAFLRRMQFIIRFPDPDEATRKELWHSVFPEEAPLEEDLDLDFLAKEAKLAGGNIKSVALAASFQAAREEGKIGMKHLMISLRQEYDKLKRDFILDDFEPYGRLIEHG